MAPGLPDNPIAGWSGTTLTGEARPARSSRRSSRSGSADEWMGLASHGLRQVSTILLALVVGICPLLVGSVHRPALIGLISATALALACAWLGERLRGNSLRGLQLSLFFLVMVLIPILQLVPLPSSLRRVIDSGGAGLLENSPGGLPRFWPLSLDPISTWQEIGTAAAAMGVFMLAVHNVTSRRRRMWVLNAVAAAGLFAVISGLAHRVFGIDRLYGVFSVFGGVLPGPFINANHSAEFYELTAFVTLALALEAEAEVRIGWYVAAGLSAAAALTTLSRGSLLGLLAGATAFLFFRRRVGT
ncbi:MAG: hypothetical protein H7X95_00265, partial [Deltaproteobacteria bacterium]|nr:hypothetical protein [Deltaproteobacteria bacterium]